MNVENDYPLTVEILEDHPCRAGLLKGNICKAKLDIDGDYLIYNRGSLAPWRIMSSDAKVI